MRIQVSNMTSPKGNLVPNQFTIRTPRKVIFQSYRTVIASRDIVTGAVRLDRECWDYSRTTLKYLKDFLNCDSTAEIRSRINKGIYKLAKLN